MELKRLISAALHAKRAFESLGRPVEHWDWFVHVVVEKLDSLSRLFWEASLQTSTEFPIFTQLQDFLQTRTRALDMACFGSSNAASVSKSQERKGKVNALTTAAAGAIGTGRHCPICQAGHLFSYCSRFKELPISQRREYAKKQGACFNCLKTKHNVANCPSGVMCLRC